MDYKKKQRVINRGAPPVPSWFVRELKTISPNLELKWMPQIKRFAVVTPCPINISSRGYMVEAIIHRDDNYKEPDMSVITELKRRMSEKNKLRHLDEIPQQMKREEQERIDKAEAERVAMQHEFMKKAYHFMKRETFVLPGEDGVGSGN